MESQLREAFTSSDDFTEVMFYGRMNFQKVNNNLRLVMKGLLIILLTTCLSICCRAQNFSIDSLMKIGQNRLDAKKQADVYWKLTSAFTRNNLDSTLKYANLAIDFGKKYKLNEPLAWGLIYKGNALGERGNYDSCLAYERKGLELLREIENNEFLARAYNLMGNGFAFRHVDDSSIYYFEKSVEKGKPYKYSEGYCGLAKIYNRTQDFKSGLLYAEKAYRESAPSDLETKIRSLGMMARAHYHFKQDTAISLYNEAIRLARENRKYIHVRNFAEIISGTYISQGQFAKAKPLALEAYNMSVRSGEKQVEGSCLINLAEIAFAENDNKQALDYGLMAYKITKEHNFFYLLRGACVVLMKVNVRLGDLKSVSYYQNQIEENNAADFEIANSKAIMDYKIKYETLQKEQENVELRSQQLTAEAAIQRQKTAVIVVAMMLILVVIITAFLVRAYQNKKRTNKLLEINNLAILSINKEIESRQSEIEKQKNEIEIQREQLAKALFEREEAQTHLVHSEKMASLGQLMAGIAHELNNPIGFISAGALALNNQLLEVRNRYSTMTNGMDRTVAGTTQKKIDEEFWQEIQDLIKAVLVGAERSTNIVNSLRTFSYESPEGVQHSDLIQSIEATLVILQSEIKNRLDVKKSFNPIPLVECNIGEISQVFMNIIANAVHAIDGKGTIWITTGLSHDKGSVLVSVKDSGHGIPEQLMRRIFDPFFTTKPHGKGTGLGLSISYNIIQKHRGNIEVLSKKGEGAEFIITIPVQ
jgi:two-component system NtrC family sensor kinase